MAKPLTSWAVNRELEAQLNQYDDSSLVYDQADEFYDSYDATQSFASRKNRTDWENAEN